jgi:hypothetical protein
MSPPEHELAVGLATFTARPKTLPLLRSCKNRPEIGRIGHQVFARDKIHRNQNFVMFKYNQIKLRIRPDCAAKLLNV